jgi:hypothetical protein
MEKWPFDGSVLDSVNVPFTLPFTVQVKKSKMVPNSEFEKFPASPGGVGGWKLARFPPLGRCL